MFSLFKQEPKTELRVVARRKCWCGSDSFGFLRADDAVHCYQCGAMYLISPSVSDPVAKIERVEVPRD